MPGKLIDIIGSQVVIRVKYYGGNGIVRVELLTVVEKVKLYWVSYRIDLYDPTKPPEFQEDLRPSVHAPLKELKEYWRREDRHWGTDKPVVAVLLHKSPGGGNSLSFQTALVGSGNPELLQLLSRVLGELSHHFDEPNGKHNKTVAKRLDCFIKAKNKEAAEFGIGTITQLSPLEGYTR